MIYNFEVISQIPWASIESCPDSNVYKTECWMHHLKESLGVQSLVIAINTDSSEVLGWFVGGLVKKLGIKILASPFEGWATSFQGLSMKHTVTPEERLNIYRQLFDYCFKVGICSFIQVTDWGLDHKTPGLENFKTSQIESYYLDLTPSESELYRSFKQKSAQYAIHKAERLRVVVKEILNIDAFAEEYYKELEDVFAKQQLKPTYNSKRVRSLLQNMEPTGKVIALEALHPETKVCMATIIFLHHNDMAFYWGAASWREYQKYCPNELLFFEACKILKAKGVKLLELEGIRKYKEKYNPIEYSKPKLVAAKWPILITCKELAKRTYYKLQDIRGKYSL